MQAILITLQRKPERKLNASMMRSQLEKQGFDVTEMPATDYQTRSFREVEFAASKDSPGSVLPGELACTWSHIRACKMVVESGRSAFIIEDDCLLLRPLKDVNVDQVPEFLQLSHWAPEDLNNQRFEVLEELEGMKRVQGLTYGTQVYYVTPLGAQKILDHAPPVNCAPDVALHILSIEGKLNTMLANEPAGIQHPLLDSHIGQR